MPGGFALLLFDVAADRLPGTGEAVGFGALEHQQLDAVLGGPDDVDGDDVAAQARHGAGYSAHLGIVASNES